MKSFTRLSTTIILMLTLLFPSVAWAFDSGILNPDWRPGTTDSTTPSTNQPAPSNPSQSPSIPGNSGVQATPTNDPVQQNINNKYFDPNGAKKLQNEAGQLKDQMDQPANPPSPNSTNLFKDPNFNDLIQSPPTSNSNTNGNPSSQQAALQNPGNNTQDNNKKGKFGLLATLVCMGALFPISSAIRNIMMGFLTWLGVNEEKTARQMAGTLSGLASISHLAGSGLNSIIGKSGNTFGGNTLGNVGSKVPPIGGGVGFPAGGVEKIPGSMLGGVSNSSVPASPGKSIDSGISTGGVAGNASQTKNITGNVLGGSGTGKSTGVSSSGGISPGSSPGSLPGSDATGPITGPGSIGVGKIEEAESPQIGEVGNNLTAGVNPLPAEASAAIDRISGEGLSATSSPGGIAPLYKDMLRNDNQSRKIYNAVAQAGNLADGFAPGSSKLLAATASNLATVPMAAYQVAKGVSQIKREGNMSFRDAVKAYTNSNNWGTGLAKMAGGVAGSAAGMGPFGVTAVGTSINVAGKTKDYAIAGGKLIGHGFHKITKTIFS